MGAPREYLEAKYGIKNVLSLEELEKRFTIEMQTNESAVLKNRNGKVVSCSRQLDPPLYYNFSKY